MKWIIGLVVVTLLAIVGWFLFSRIAVYFKAYQLSNLFLA